MCHENPDSSEVPAVRAVNFRRLAAHYRIDPEAEEGSSSAPPERYALVMIESDAPTSENYLTTARTFEDACQTAGEEILDSGRLPDGVYDLDTGQRLELHTATPVVTLSEDQGMRLNPLTENAGTAAPGGDRG
jgi:hypothetical protein